VDAGGQPVARLQAPYLEGIHRVIWNLRRDSLPPGPANEESGGRPLLIAGPLVMPGDYTVRLTAGGKTFEQKLQVLEDPRIQVSAAERKQWTDALIAVGEMYRSATSLGDQAQAGSSDLRRIVRELQSRLSTLYRDMARSTAKPTADQQAQMQFFEAQLRSLRARLGR
jgi:hypothetical protein